ncbi:hypothetical protein [Schinkia azotoformans]|uniref:hypothetical protein n=1 Tax=Schinkia azotoformans TaxID=1454 RepID=UPI002DB80AD8|nr:hypothetical protein [Schinkia azotoformans]MEC1722529.1 hypothetical protein [Schinkia azotoformans]MED4415865.1 hypothetical protein [Schinkia azotoformans]
MTKDFQLKLEEYNRLQRKGDDQTANYSLLFGNNKRVVEMAKIDAIKEKVQNGAFYLSRKKSKRVDEYLIIDMFNGGNIDKINSDQYTAKVVDDNILVIDNITGDEHFLITEGKLDYGNVKHLGSSNYTYFSTNRERGFMGVPAVRFNNNFSDSIRVHWIVALMKWGIEDLNKCVGDSPIYTLLHKVAYVKSKDNSISNLRILTVRNKAQPYGECYQ